MQTHSARKTCFISLAAGTDLSPLIAALEGHGFAVVVPTQLGAGQRWLDALTESLKTVDLVVSVFGSREAIANPVFEIGYALGIGKPVLVIVSPTAEDLPFAFSSLLVVRAEPTDREAIEFALDRLPANPLRHPVQLAQARELRLAADVILPSLEEALSLPSSSLGAQEKRLAYVHSYMLLNGLAFENLIKGILIGRAPAFVTKEKVKSGILERGGHGIANGAKEIISLSSNEVDLLKRLEEYLFWAGRYPLPMKLGIYLNSETQELRRFQTNDPALINQVFNRLIIVLEQEWKARS